MRLLGNFADICNSKRWSRLILTALTLNLRDASDRLSSDDDDDDELVVLMNIIVWPNETVP